MIDATIGFPKFQCHNDLHRSLELLKSQVHYGFFGGSKERGHKELGQAMAIPARCRFLDFMGNYKGFAGRLCHNSARFLPC